jgi:transcriptional regulator with XRE-family HTH domain
MSKASDKLRKYMEDKKLTQVTFAGLLGLTQSTISNALNDKRLRETTKQIFKDELNIPLAWWYM